MLPILMLLNLLVFPMPAKANCYQVEALQLAKEAEQKKHLYLEEAKALQARAESHLGKAVNLQKIAPAPITNACQRSDFSEKNFAHNNGEYIVFVSLSMPKETLKSLHNEANEQNAVLLLRGLKENSFKKTAEYLRELEMSVQINPELFKKYQVSKAPTFVWIKGNEYHTLTGNISLQYAKDKFLEIGK